MPSIWHRLRLWLWCREIIGAIDCKVVKLNKKWMTNGHTEQLGNYDDIRRIINVGLVHVTYQLLGYIVRHGR